MIPRPVPFTWAGCRAGARLSLPFLPGVLAFSAAYGTVAVQKGLTFAEAVAMSAIVFAGASQMVALEIWREPLEPALALAICGVVAAVNMRLVLMGASLRPWIGGLPGSKVYPTMPVLTDVNWIVAIRYRADGGEDFGVFVGSGLLIWSVWTLGSIPGYVAGGLVPDPRAYALDLVMPAFFVVMLIPLWKGARAALPWLVSGVVATATAFLVPGYWFIVTGALAGSLAGALTPPPEDADGRG